jgi:hypothetical protein
MKAPRLLVLASVTTAFFVIFTGSATANRGNDPETVRLLDDCDPVTFNAVLGAGACIGDGDTTFEEFGEALAEGGDHHWRNNPKETTVKRGHGLHLVNRGGEFHTFTKVDSFAAGGCVPELNGPLGLPGRDPAFCGAAFSDPVLAVPAGAESEVPSSALERGHNHFQCMIHPWMTTTVTVRGDR